MSSYEDPAFSEVCDLHHELAAARAETDIMIQACDRLVADVKRERRRNEELVELLREIQDNWLFGIQPEIRERIDRALEGRDGQV